MHEAVANHYSLPVNDDGSKFLINANQIHFSKVKVSNLLLWTQMKILSHGDAPDPTAQSSHHIGCAHTSMRNACAFYICNCSREFMYSTLPPIEQNSVMFLVDTSLMTTMGVSLLKGGRKVCSVIF